MMVVHIAPWHFTILSYLIAYLSYYLLSDIPFSSKLLPLHSVESS